MVQNRGMDLLICMICFGWKERKKRKEILEKYLPNYKINLVDAERLEDVEKFSDDLQVILTMLRYRDSKEELKHYIDENKKVFFRMLIMKQVRR